ncbi:6,7-dimethyl-8-ribityllumazine synthase [Rhodospirillales bacterium]|nr:6,7-dimethyl-8-ribityllumazine synthase [Rhodospirillales bacterium]
MSKKIIFIQARWHADIVDQALVGFKARLDEHNVVDYDVVVYDVPGAFEIPLLAQKLAKDPDVIALVAAGFVVDGGIYRHDFVADAVVTGLMNVQLKTETPMFSVVLTPHQFSEGAAEHIAFFSTHFVTKGREAADAVVATLNVHEGVTA